MDFLAAVILGLVEGLTEFLPVSSTGHLIILNHWLGFEKGFETLFDVFIQLGAILAVLVYFRKKLFAFGRGITSEIKKNALTLWKKVLIAVLPALVLGYLLGDIIEEYLFNAGVVAAALIIWGVIILCVDRKRKNEQLVRIENCENLDYRMALLIGAVQCLAMVPGTSRSAATIIGAMLLGCSRMAAAEFSFFLAIPTMIAASGYTLLKHGKLLETHEILVLSTGFITAFLTALLVITVFLKYIASHRFTAFGWYRIVLGLSVCALLLFR